MGGLTANGKSPSGPVVAPLHPWSTNSDLYRLNFQSPESEKERLTYSKYKPYLASFVVLLKFTSTTSSYSTVQYIAAWVLVVISSLHMPKSVLRSQLRILQTHCRSTQVAVNTYARYNWPQTLKQTQLNLHGLVLHLWAILGCKLQQLVPWLLEQVQANLLHSGRLLWTPMLDLDGYVLPIATSPTLSILDMEVMGIASVCLS